MSGIRAEVRIDSPPNCLVAAASAAADAESTSVTWTGSGDAEAAVTEEFLLQGDAEVALDGADTDASEVFRYDGMGAYRFERPPDAECPCAFVERFDTPVRDVYARNGALVVAFHVSEIERLQEILEGLNREWSNVSVDRLTRSGETEDVEKLVLVDRDALTDRQREVLETAHEMGYFDHPKRANAGEVADALDINATTFTEHLSAAQRKLLGAVLDG